MSDADIDRRARERASAERTELENEASSARDEVEEKEREAQRKTALCCHRLGFVVDGDSFTNTTLRSVQLLAAITALIEIWGRVNSVHPDRSPDVYAPEVVGLMFLVFVAVQALLMTIEKQVAAAWAAEQAWLSKLSYGVKAYVDEISETYSGTDRLTLRITVDGSPGNVVEEARGLLQRIDPEGVARVDGSRLEISARILPKVEDSAVARRHARILFHDLIEAVVDKLSARVQAVELDT